MIRRLAIREFQNHVEETLILDMVTVFYGPSDRGKSALMRAIRWAALNRPLGDDMVGRWGEAEVCQVELTFDNGTVARRRGGEVNGYRINNGKPLRAMGGVPVPVALLVNMDEVNFADGHEGPFWFMLPAGEVSRRLNSIINLGEIDQSLANAAAAVRRANLAVDVARDRKLAAERERDALAWVPAARAAVERLTKLTAARDTAAQTAANLRSAYQTIAQANQTIKNAADAEKALARIVELGRAALAAADRARRLWSLAAAIAAADRAASATPPDPKRLTVLLKHRDDLDRRVHTLTNAWMWLSGLEKEIRDYGEEIQCLEKRLKGSAVCPTCGSPIRPRSPSRLATSTLMDDDPPRAGIRIGGPS